MDAHLEQHQQPIHQPAANQARGIAMILLHAQEQAETGARLQEQALDIALHQHARFAQALQNIIVIQIQNAKE